jgi:hypothetical protein
MLPGPFLFFAKWRKFATKNIAALPWVEARNLLKLGYNRKVQFSRGLKRCNTLTWHKQEVLEGNASPHPPMENYSKWRKILWQNSPNKGRT